MMSVVLIVVRDGNVEVKIVDSGGRCGESCDKVGMLLIEIK